MMAFTFGKKFEYSLKIIAKIQASRKLNDKVNQYRESGGNEIIQIGYSLRTIYERLKLKNIFCFLIDQSANPDYSVYVNFFGKNVATFSGPSRIALKKRPLLIFGYGVRQKDFSYKMYFENINYDDLTEYNDENVIELTQRIQTKLEEVIRKNPGQWLWLHKRFKHTKSE
jgi:KDO2-lipid IV(A) lauroyltransferase